MASNMMAQSSTVRVIGETVSIVHARGTTLWLLTRPMVGRIPTMPLTAEGGRMEPPVSVPRAPRHVRAATAAPDPPLDPAGKRSGFQGLRHVPEWGLSVVPPHANSCKLVLPMITAPARLRRAVTVASSPGTKAARIFDPAGARTPRV